MTICKETPKPEECKKISLDFLKFPLYYIRSNDINYPIQLSDTILDIPNRLSLITLDNYIRLN